MTDLVDTEEEAAPEETVDTDLESVDTEEQADQEEHQKPFNPEQEQYIGSWLGRIVADQIDKKVAPLVQDKQPPPHQPVSDDALKKFNDEVSEQFFGGDPTGAFNKMMNVHKTAQDNIASQNKIATDRAITSYSDDPLYKDIYQDMNKIAHEKVIAGFPPAAAAEFAFTAATANHYKSQVVNKPGGGNLKMSGGGRQERATKQFKLRPEFKKAAARDIASGYFKDEQDYINNLSPHVRAKAVI